MGRSVAAGQLVLPLAQREPVTVAIPNYNGRDEIGEAIESVKTAEYQVAEIIVVDDGSTDGSPSYIRARFPDVRVIELGRNTKLLNRVRNRALQEAQTRLVFLMDHDVTVDPRCLSMLVSALQELPDAAVLTPRALYHDNPGRVYNDNQRMHFLCNSVAPNRGGSIPSGNDRPRPSIGWGTQLIDKQKAALVGFFDEDYVMGWGDDGEFHYKLHLAGLRCYSVPRATVFHTRSSGAGRVYGGVRNRWYLLIETYQMRSILLLAPALVVYELALFVLLLLRGQAGAYLRAMRDVLANLQHVLHKRAAVQRMRTRSDRELLSGGPLYIPGHVVHNGLARLFASLLSQGFTVYWNLVERFI